MNEATYKDKFKAAMKDFGINSLDDLKSDADKKKFFKHVDGMHTAKNEELTPAQKKLPAGLQKAIAAKQDDKKEELDDTDKETIKPIIKQLKKSVTAHDKQAKQLEKDITDDKKEGFSSDAQRKAAFASGYKEKDKKKDEMMKASYKKEETEEVSEMMKPQEMAVNAMAMNAMKMNAMKMPIRAMYKKEMKTGDDDMQPMSSMKMNAMTDPKKMNAMTMQDPKQDMAAGYMKSDVRAAVKDGGGKDMAKVKDKPEMMAAMKKINATYKREKYLPVKEGSIQDTIAQMYQTESQEMNVKGKELDKMIQDYLKKGGVITKLPPALAKGMKPSDMETYKVKMKEVREFVTTYNSHFLTNFKAEELVEENLTEAVTKYDITMADASFFKGNDLMKAMNQTKKDGNSDKALDDIQMYSADVETGISFVANNPGEATRMAEKAILNFRNKQVKNDRNALFAFDRLEIQLVNNKLPTSRDNQLLKRTLEKYSNEAMFNTPNGKGPGNLQKFVQDESLDDMVVDGVM